MDPRREEQQQQKREEPRREGKPRRFRIVKLEERIAPGNAKGHTRPGHCACGGPTCWCSAYC
jgi:hypothetical protein